MAEPVSLTLKGSFLLSPPKTTTTMSSSLRTTTAASRLLRSSSFRSTLPLSASSSSLSFVRSLVSSPLLSSASLSQKRYRVASVNRSVNESASAKTCSASDPDQSKNAREDIKELLNTKFCHPILVWLGW